MTDDEYEAINFIREQVLGWISNLMRDLDAQGYAVSLEEVAAALSMVIEEIVEAHEDVTNEDYDNFLRELNDGRGNE